MIQNGSKINTDHVLTGKNGGKARILVAPLDWGLGHATRCIPIIHELIKQGAEPFLAGERAQEELLRSEFPQLQFIPLTGYRVLYSKTASGLVWKMMRQVPQLQNAIRMEQEWLQKAIRKYQLKAVISDNRYGLYNENVPCVFLTHQLLIKTGTGKWIERLLQKKNYRYIKRFSECWVPDQPGESNLAGELSHPRLLPQIPVKYCGLLTRMIHKGLPEKKGHLLIILSGPEPQRTIFENKIIDQLSYYAGSATVVRGLPGNQNLVPSTNMIRFYNHLPSEDLNKEMEQAEFIVSRSGYSTLMDVMTLQKKCVFVPTPGQTEQEYLARYHAGKNGCNYMLQNSFNLNVALNIAPGSCRLGTFDTTNNLPGIIRSFLNGQ